ncbi:hypothetical protein NCCP2716_14070 [Sporosarcina sp. NCCP-2716]|uniref:PBECR4 domain-containing protein n=1 Tax=Sporosarcina sp. NCCP-2716 TaxID=2943679 RepID=UPI00203B89ED|nr:PBECR4 domain-containing protein [Sporosarcina sp. NCCP-2716]GKV68909.1 hypothetical protein NCCP2716_14070 [Sporosarcina sp. NCCP-2716]
MSNNNLLKKLQNGLREYDKIVDKHIVYVYLVDGKYRELHFKPAKSNFMHLCGIEYRDKKNGEKMNAIQFYKALQKNKISPNGITKKSFTDQKLQIINCISDLTNCTVRILDGQVTFLHLSFDKAIRSKKQIFCLSLIRKQGTSYVPNSLLNLRSDKSHAIGKGHPVHRIFLLDHSTNNAKTICQTSEFDVLKYNNYPQTD